MKVLVTGFTGVQAHASTGQLDIISNLMSIVGALEDLGHEVEWRPVFPGEYIDDYGAVIVSVNGIASWVSPYALGGLWAIGSRPDSILTMDDWQAPNAFRAGEPEKELGVVWNEKLNRIGHAEAYSDPGIKSRIDEAVEMLCYIHYRKMLIPAFSGGDLALLNLGAPNALKYDPSPYMVDRYSYAPDMEKSRIWVMAGLAEKDRWLKYQTFKWPLESYGVRKLGQPRVRESQLAEIYSQRWGIISAPHPHKGSGWFRVRFLMAALARSIVYCDPAEGKVLGPSYTYTASEIEAGGESELKQLADDQAFEFFRQAWSKERLMDEIARLLALPVPKHGERIFTPTN